jgi:uncharacterized protein YqhQ
MDGGDENRRTVSDAAAQRIVDTQQSEKREKKKMIFYISSVVAKKNILRFLFVKRTMFFSPKFVRLVKLTKRTNTSLYTLLGTISVRQLVFYVPKTTFEPSI